MHGALYVLYIMEYANEPRTERWKEWCVDKRLSYAAAAAVATVVVVNDMVTFEVDRLFNK